MMEPRARVRRDRAFPVKRKRPPRAESSAISISLSDTGFHFLRNHRRIVAYSSVSLSCHVFISLQQASKMASFLLVNGFSDTHI